MQDFFQEEAVAYLLKCYPKKEFEPLLFRLPQWLPQWMAWEMAFEEEQEAAGKETYDEDDLFEYIYQHQLEAYPEFPDDDLLIATAVDNYLMHMEKFLDRRQ